MCYDLQSLLETQLRRAERDGDVHAIYEIMERMVELTDLPIHHNSGFMHPSLLIYTVDKLRGKTYQGNVEKISNKVVYPELEEIDFI